jgi:hypothetical protein
MFKAIRRATRRHSLGARIGSPSKFNPSAPDGGSKPPESSLLGGPPRHCLTLVRTQVHQSEVVFSMLVVVLCCDSVATLSLSTGQRQISLIA